MRDPLCPNRPISRQGLREGREMTRQAPPQVIENDDPDELGPDELDRFTWGTGDVEWC